MHSFVSRRIRQVVVTAAALGGFGVGLVMVTSPATAATHPLPPARLLDTRDGTGGHGRFAAGEIVSLPIAGRGDVPSNATSVALNVTAVSPAANGFLSVWPCGGAEPQTSNLNFVTGQVVANSVIVGIGSGGAVCLRSSAATHVLADVSTWFDGSSPAVPLSPKRLVDTRSGLGFEERDLRAGEILTVHPGLSGEAGAALINLTATGTNEAGFLTAYPCDGDASTSTVNFDRGATVPNGAVVALSGAGTICVTSSVATDVLVDLMGWVRNGGESVKLRPARILDTRNGVGAAKGPVAGTPTVLHVAGRGGAPSGSGIAVLNVTSTEATGNGFVTAYPCDRPKPGTSTLNIVRGRNVANLAVVPVSNDGTVCLSATMYSGSVQLVGDLTGWLSATALPALVPSRFGTLAIGEPLPSGAECAGRVRRVPENKPRNAAKNAVRITPKALATSGPFARVDGQFSGTTDELLQWAACKWGVDEDIVRAMAAIESWWRWDTLGDMTTNSAVCAYGHSLGSAGVAGQCPQSTGLLQINWQYYKEAYPEAAASNAYHLDYGLAVYRNCFEGALTWLRNTGGNGGSYGAGDAWGCVGFWNAGRWHDAKAEGYIARVQATIAERLWEQPRFQE